MRYDLKGPCLNCPFRTDETRIRFYNRDRAEEIEGLAFWRGFACHLSAVYREGDGEDDDRSGFVPGPNTQHCMGAIIMFINDGHDWWPGIDCDQALVERLREQIDKNAPVFETVDAFLKANE